jgi:NTP pyrophosphatase (non-canonical NTP hydrolase)
VELNDYQREAAKTAVYPDVGKNVTYPTLGLCGEAGEVAEKVKKYLRDGTPWDEVRITVRKELGDVLWYVAMVANEFDLTLDGIANANVMKLRHRHGSGTLHGSGDDR